MISLYYREARALSPTFAQATAGKSVKKIIWAHSSAPTHNMQITMRKSGNRRNVGLVERLVYSRFVQKFKLHLEFL